MQSLIDGTFDADAQRPVRQRVPPFSQTFQQASEGLEAMSSDFPPQRVNHTQEPHSRIPEWSSEAYRASLAAANASSGRGSPAALTPTTSSGESELAELGRQIFRHERKSLSQISLRALCIGVVFGWATASIPALVAAAWRNTSVLESITKVPWTIPFFVATLSVFHFLEFWTTATYNTKAVKVSSFLLSLEDRAYNAAHTLAITESLVRWRFFPNSVSAGWRLPVILVGLTLVVMGQTVRSLAMKHAGVSFNHQVQQQKAESHVLVTSGVFAYFRHPSYFGFFWWAIGTQLVLGNMLCLTAYIFILWKFFKGRITRKSLDVLQQLTESEEERYLMGFFGLEYKRYRESTRVFIPFIN